RPTDRARTSARDSTRGVRRGGRREARGASRSDADPCPAASLDAVVTIRNYHDLKNPAEALAELRRVLKPGGILDIADSRTTAGRDEPTHRIAEDVIVREVTAAGFSLAGVSQMLSNPKDDYTRVYWDARWIVDQSCLKFTR
ncbi:MAG: methyltransferase domain-containing protein, partial [Acidobacteria bacterium]|nr:methyltransferase domain-containing protein [Acidobacteriota bacterium]